MIIVIHARIHAYMHLKGIITIPNTGTAVAPINTNKTVIFKNCVPFNGCISEITNTQVDNAKYIDVVISMYNLIEYS